MLEISVTFLTVLGSEAKPGLSGQSIFLFEEYLFMFLVTDRTELLSIVPEEKKMSHILHGKISDKVCTV